MERKILFDGDGERHDLMQVGWLVGKNFVSVTEWNEQVGWLPTGTVIKPVFVEVTGE